MLELRSYLGVQRRTDESADWAISVGRREWIGMMFGA